MREINIKIDLYGNNFPRYQLKQYDATILHISVYASSAPYQLDGLAMSLTAVLPDGTAVVQADNAAIYGNHINIGLTDAVVEQIGNVRFELVLTRGGRHVSTYIFSAIVEPALLQKEKIVYEDVSENIYKAITAALEASAELTEHTGEVHEILAHIDEYVRAIDEALTKMGEYDASAAQAVTSAANQAKAALGSAEAAYTSRMGAEAAANAAKTSETNANASKTAAANFAANASSSAAEAASAVANNEKVLLLEQRINGIVSEIEQLLGEI